MFRPFSRALHYDGIPQCPILGIAEMLTLKSCRAFESLFFAIFLALYYAVLVERNPRQITIIEALLYIWIAAFACDEFGEFRDAGTLFYAADFWSLWDIIIIAIGIAFFISSRSLTITVYSCRILSSFLFSHFIKLIDR